jgi:hypothetical protein
MKPFAFIDRWSGRTANALAIWPLLPAGIVSGVVAYASTWVPTLKALGPFAWLSTAVLTFAVLSGSLLFLALARDRWVLAREKQKWLDQSDSDINPMETEFIKKRITLSRFVNELFPRITNKRFIDCELVGPSSVMLLDGMSLTRSRFVDCNFIPIKPGAGIYHAIGMSNCRVQDCTLIGLTFFIPMNIIPIIEESGMSVGYVSLTGISEIDRRT